MICENCSNEFDNINGLKFCPFCGTSIEGNTDLEARQNADFEEQINVEIQQNTDKIDADEKNSSSEGGKETDKLEDTLEMPVITKEDIRRYKREKFFKTYIEPFTKMKVAVPLATIFIVIAVGAFSYVYFFGNSVDEERIKADLIGKVVTLPKGTNIEIKKGNINNFIINSRSTSKSEKKDDIKAAVTINNGNLEVSTLLSIQYIYEGRNKWTISENIGIAGETSVKPLAVMDEKVFLENLRKFTIIVGNTNMLLSDGEVKTLQIAERKPDLNNFQEEILVEAVIDNGLLSAAGKLKCIVKFENEAWGLSSVEKSGTEDFALVLSSAFNQDRIIDIIKKEGLEATVANANVFGGKGYFVKDSFTKSFTIPDKKYDAQKGELLVSVKRENAAGELNSTLSTDYTFSLTLGKLELMKKSKTIVDSISIADMTRDFIVSTIANAEIEGDRFFWKADNHKINADEAKTFKSDKILTKKGLQNVRYVYGNITYIEAKKEKKISFVATYFLVYDSSKGYNWKLDKIIGEDSPNYKNYYPELR